ncbi:MAG: O-antigen ligase family protein [Planctomycetaceae bacterium]|jgi:O-antigen ligase|nr:O-antigen ligase family protein [Planctomycetaceae bacterium]
MIWILVGYMWLFLHRPFEIWPILGTIRLERCYMGLTLIVWCIASAKTWSGNRNNLPLCLIAFSIFISTLLSPYNGLGENLTTENWFKVFVFFLLIMTSVKTEKDLKTLVTAFSVCYFLYMLHSFWEFRCGKGVYRMGIWRMIGIDSTMNDPNSFGNGINYALAMILPLLALAKEQMSKDIKRVLSAFIPCYVLLSCVCIMYTGSRSSFATLGGSLLGLALLSKQRVRIFIVLLIAAPCIWLATPERLKIRYISLFDPTVLEGQDMKGADESAESRSVFFRMGIQIWKDNLPFGVGPEGFQRINPAGLQSHNLYAQVLSELGTLGAIAYLSLIFAIIANHLQAGQLYKRMKKQGREREALYLYRVSFAVAWALFLLLVQGWGGHNAFRYTWVWYAAFQAIAIELLKQKADALPNIAHS